MKTTLLLSTLAVSLIGATPSFAQVNMWPSRPYDARGYEDLSPGRSDYGYYQGRAIPGRQAPHARVSPRSVEPSEELR